MKRKRSRKLRKQGHRNQQKPVRQHDGRSSSLLHHDALTDQRPLPGSSSDSSASSRKRSGSSTPRPLQRSKVAKISKLQPSPYQQRAVIVRLPLQQSPQARALDARCSVQSKDDSNDHEDAITTDDDDANATDGQKQPIITVELPPPVNAHYREQLKSSLKQMIPLLPPTPAILCKTEGASHFRAKIDRVTTLRSALLFAVQIQCHEETQLLLESFLQRT